MRPSYRCPECSLCCSGDSCCLRESRAHSAREGDAGLARETTAQTFRVRRKGLGTENDSPGEELGAETLHTAGSPEEAVFL